MKYDEAVRKLAQTYQAADHGEKTVAAVLFGIRYADEISGMDIYSHEQGRSRWEVYGEPDTRWHEAGEVGHAKRLATPAIR